MPFFDRLATSVLWRARLWAWGDWLRVGSKYVHREPTLISPYVAKLMALGRQEKPEWDLPSISKYTRTVVARPDRRNARAHANSRIFARADS